jgi:hypothetical protein
MGHPLCWLFRHSLLLLPHDVAGALVALHNACVLIGHYGVSFAVKSIDRRIPLWILFLATQFLDVVWGVLVPLGIEKVRIVPGITATLPLDLYYIPYSHSFVCVVLWSAGVFVFCKYVALRRWEQSGRAAALIAIGVLSHWFLDLVVHRPDLPLYDNSHKVGLGLWNYPKSAFALETIILFAGIWLSLRQEAGENPLWRCGITVFGIFLLAVQWVSLFLVTPPSPTVAALSFLSIYGLLAGAIAWVENKAVVLKAA